MDANEKDLVVDVDFGTYDATEPESSVFDDNQVAITSDFSNVFSDEVDRDAERQAEIKEVVEPLLQENTKKIMQQQHDKFKLDVYEVLNDEVTHRLGKYEKRRKRREFREGLGVVLKWLFIAAVIALFFSNDQLREGTLTIAGDVKEIVIGLMNDEEVSSNKLVDDILNLGGEFNGRK